MAYSAHVLSFLLCPKLVVEKSQEALKPGYSCVAVTETGSVVPLARILLHQCYLYSYSVRVLQALRGCHYLHINYVKINFEFGGAAHRLAL